MTASLLAIDCSTERLCIALGHGGRTWAREEQGGPLASARAVPGLLALLAEAGLGLRQLDAVAFARGPGAFTGLRTACAVAQGLALGTGKPVLPIDSLMLVAQAAWHDAGRPEGFDIWVAMDARMEEVYAGRYCREGAQWQVLQAPALYELAALQACWGGAPEAVTGTAIAAFGHRLGLASGTRCLPSETGRSLALLEVANQAWLAGESVAADQAWPLYLRDKVALTTAERASRAVEVTR